MVSSRGLNIYSREIEEALLTHPAVSEACASRVPDDKWGETVCAFVDLRKGAGAVTDEDIMAFCREHIARFKCPRYVIFGPLPKTSTGKIQKFRLRETAKTV
jgi:fatty-acyl-CoA synthase